MSCVENVGESLVSDFVLWNFFSLFQVITGAYIYSACICAVHSLLFHTFKISIWLFLVIYGCSYFKPKIYGVSGTRGNPKYARVLACQCRDFPQIYAVIPLANIAIIYSIQLYGDSSIRVLDMYDCGHKLNYTTCQGARFSCASFYHATNAKWLASIFNAKRW